MDTDAHTVKAAHHTHTLTHRSLHTLYPVMRHFITPCFTRPLTIAFLSLSNGPFPGIHTNAPCWLAVAFEQRPLAVIQTRETPHWSKCWCELPHFLRCTYLCELYKPRSEYMEDSSDLDSITQAQYWLDIHQGVRFGAVPNKNPHLVNLYVVLIYIAFSRSMLAKFSRRTNSVVGGAHAERSRSHATDS